MWGHRVATDSNREFHRAVSSASREDEELRQKATRALEHTTDPLEKLRLLCLCRGASGIVGIGRIFHRMNHDGKKTLTKEEFFKGIQEAGLELTDADAEALFYQFDTDRNGLISIAEFLAKFRPPMSEQRKAIIEKCFRKLDKTGEGLLSIDDVKKVYTCNSNSRYMNGDESAEIIIDKFLANFESGAIVDGKITLEEFMNYYAGLSVAIDNDCYFDLMMRQAYKL